MVILFKLVLSVFCQDDLWYNCPLWIFCTYITFNGSLVTHVGRDKISPRRRHIDFTVCTFLYFNFARFECFLFANQITPCIFLHKFIKYSITCLKTMGALCIVRISNVVYSNNSQYSNNQCNGPSISAGIDIAFIYVTILL